MKPGPATSTFSIRSSARSFSAISSASSRGFLPASFASTIAALVAMSPCAGVARRLDHARAKGRARAARPTRSAPRSPRCTRLMHGREDVRSSPPTCRFVWCCERALSQESAGRSKLSGNSRACSVEREAVGHAGDEIARRGARARPRRPDRGPAPIRPACPAATRRSARTARAPRPRRRSITPITRGWRYMLVQRNSLMRAVGRGHQRPRRRPSARRRRAPRRPRSAP